MQVWSAEGLRESVNISVAPRRLLWGSKGSKIPDRMACGFQAVVGESRLRRHFLLLLRKMKSFHSYREGTTRIPREGR